MSELSDKKASIKDLMNAGLLEIGKIREECQKKGGSCDLIFRSKNIISPDLDDEEIIQSDAALSKLDTKFYDEIRALYQLLLAQTDVEEFMREIDQGNRELAWDLQHKYFGSLGLPDDWLDSDSNYEEFLRISVIGATASTDKVTKIAQSYRKAFVAWYYQIYENFEEAKKWCLDALNDNANEHLAAFTLGEMYSNGQLEQDFEKAEYYLNIAVEYEHEDAMGQLAYVLVAGEENQENERRGFLLASKAHELGSIKGTNVLAYCYENGIGTRKNGPKAEDLYAQASEEEVE
ncbi:sel1 repeat family protein [Alphaproteobacteria bacterium]|nr:sel1 repeat family protein [Alphaproteobacteria bacterium]